MIIKTLRELDALIAEKVMGWKFIKKHSWLRPNGVKHILHPFSRSFENAWAVVEKMQSFGYTFEICDYGDTKEYGVEFHKYVGGDIEWERYSVANKDVKIAICLAALKAKGIEVELNLGGDE